LAAREHEPRLGRGLEPCRLGAREQLDAALGERAGVRARQDRAVAGHDPGDVVRLEKHVQQLAAGGRGPLEHARRQIPPAPAPRPRADAPRAARPGGAPRLPGPPPPKTLWAGGAGSPGPPRSGRRQPSRSAVTAAEALAWPPGSSPARRRTSTVTPGTRRTRV